MVGAAGAVAIAALYRRWRWLIAVSALACVPARIPVHVGSTDANLLVGTWNIRAFDQVNPKWRTVAKDSPIRDRSCGSS